MSHELNVQRKLNDSDVTHYDDSTSKLPAQSTSSSSESLQEYNCDEVDDRQGDAIEESNRASDTESGNGQGSASDSDDAMSDSKKLEDMPDTEQPRQTQSPTFEDATMSKEDGSINGATTDSEPWSRSDTENSEALTHAQGDVHTWHS